MELRELPLASDHRRVQAPRDRRDHLADAEQTPRQDALGLALQLERLDRLGFDGLANEAVGRLAEQDLTRRRLLLQAGGDVDCVAGHECRVGCGGASHDLAGVHADPDLDGRASVAFELLVERGELLAHVRRGTDRPQSIVLV